MLFNSIQFLIFFPIVLMILFVLPKKWRSIWLLAASYYFYMKWNARYALLIGFSTLITYVCGLLMEYSGKKGQEDSKTKKKFWLVLCLVINFGILFYFKYSNFGIDILNRILSFLHAETISGRFDVMLPVGISFYTFQALGYTLDVYRGEVRAEKNLIQYALFVSFFPQLVAGPIERTKNLLSQIQNVDRIKFWNWERIQQGLAIMLWGYFQKMVIADRLAVLVDTVYNNYSIYGSVELILATVLFSIQIYCDFAGYSCIAMGASKIMGIDLMTNFASPYFATSVPEFWRRWHISLSTWFRDYLYIPLGGNRKGNARKYINLMITFLVSGLWHGASLNFVAWGAIHGLFQVIGLASRGLKKKINGILHTRETSVSYLFMQTFVTFLLVNFAWIFFRARSITQAFDIIKRIFFRFNPWVLFDDSLYALGLVRKEFWIAVLAVLVLLITDFLKKYFHVNFYAFLKSQCIWFRWGVYILAVCVLFVFGIYGSGFDASQFIYFQF